MAEYRGSIGVFCGSSSQIDNKYLRIARELGEWIANNNFRLVYGGGGVGMMGEAARACAAQGGAVLGILPKFLLAVEGIGDAPKPVLVDTMHERKTQLYAESDLFVTLPGGIGTLEELIELISWRRLSLHEKPMLLFNFDGYWSELIAQLHRFEEDKFLPENPFGGDLKIVDTLDALFDTIRSHWPR